MRINHTTRKLSARALAVMLALSASAALASAMPEFPSEEEGDNEAGKTEACNAIGCPNGNRICGTTTGTINSGAPPFVGVVSVSWTCYESGPAH